MSRARTVLPTDLVALVSFDGRVYPNEAKTWDRMGLHQRGPHPLEAAIEQWFSFATGKHTWISVRGPTIRGLVSARRRAKRSAWEVDCLINADEDLDICRSLLEGMAKDLGRAGAERVFLRLDADSAFLQVARQVGFFPYARERLFHCEETLEVKSPQPPFRARTKVDLWGVFQLYNALTPANVRSIEGLTFRQWQAAQEHWGGRTQDLVLEEDGVITAWLKVGGGGEGRFRLLAHPQCAYDATALVGAALARLADNKPLLCLLPLYADEFAPALRRLGFRQASEYVLLAKRLVEATEELAPEKVGQAVPVS